MFNDYMWFWGGPNAKWNNVCNECSNSFKCFFNFVFIVSKCDCICCAITDAKASGDGKVALLCTLHNTLTFLWPLRHNDIHYARACQAFSIENENMIRNRSIFLTRFFSFWTKRLQMTRDWRGKRQAATFSFHQNYLSHRNRIKLQMTPKITIYIRTNKHCCQRHTDRKRSEKKREREKFIIDEYCVYATQKWNEVDLLTIIFTTSIDMISLKIEIL